MDFGCRWYTNRDRGRHFVFLAVSAAVTLCCFIHALFAGCGAAASGRVRVGADRGQESRTVLSVWIPRSEISPTPCHWTRDVPGGVAGLSTVWRRSSAHVYASRSGQVRSGQPPLFSLSVATRRPREFFVWLFGWVWLGLVWFDSVTFSPVRSVRFVPVRSGPVRAGPFFCFCFLCLGFCSGVAELRSFFLPSK